MATDGPGRKSDVPGDLIEDGVKLLRWFSRLDSLSRELIEGLELNFDIQTLCRLGLLKPACPDVTGRWGERYVRGDCLTDA